jgi:hypothetical protein
MPARDLQDRLGGGDREQMYISDHRNAHVAEDAARPIDRVLFVQVIH